MRARRLVATLATTAALAGAGLSLGAVVPETALSAATAGATTSDEASLFALTNQARAAAGAPALSLDATISSVARSWAQTMAAQGGISHNPDLESLLGGWLGLAENVGVGSTIAQVHEALLASPAHYVNLTNPDYSLVGIGVATAGGRLYVVENFEAPAVGGRTTAIADPEPPPTVAPRATTTTVPAPPEPPMLAPPPTSVPTAAPAAAPVASTVAFVLDALRALDSAYGHH
ncbi:MAG: CAP domain-containing protein [Actinomycetota bacterium]|nr:CAP domain-containing protein [Actinomycetota bacterium]